MALLVLGTMVMHTDDYYRILQVRPDASPEVIRAAYRALMADARYHPDLGGDTREAARLGEAYTTLSNPTKRAAYDSDRPDDMTAPLWTPPLPLSPIRHTVNAATQITCTQCGAGNTVVIRRGFQVQHRTFYCGLCRTILPLRRAADRHKQRRRVNLQVRCQHAGAPPVTASVADFSDTGMHILTTTPFALGSIWEFTTSHFTATGSPVWIRARESWIDSPVYGIGVRFSQFTSHQTETVLHAVV